jgi:hypothetical protein
MGIVYELRVGGVWTEKRRKNLEIVEEEKEKNKISICHFREMFYCFFSCVLSMVVETTR